VRRAALCAAGCALACSGSPPTLPATGQILLYLDTDAPVVPADGHAPSLTEPLPLFDRARVDVLGADGGAACASCTLDVVVTADDFSAGKVSLGIATPQGASGYSARVRLYVDRFTPSGQDPNVDSTIDVTFPLPPVPASGALVVTAFLDTATAGQPQAGMVLAPGAPSPSQVGTWPAAARADCSAVPPPGMVCVPGGALWMGPPTDEVLDGTVSGWHRIAVLSPYFLDASEVTVAEARAGHIDPTQVASWDGRSTGASLLDWCTYVDAPGVRDDLPVNCVSPAGAQAFCRGAGGDLPTEAQLEYAMGGLQMQPYVWGDDPPACADAVWGRNGAGLTQETEPTTCFDPTASRPIDGPEPAGWAGRDRLVMPTGTILDLNGNLLEITRDAYEEQTGGCWSQPGPMQDPVCPTAPGRSLLAFRGGAWFDGQATLQAGSRGGNGPYDGDIYLGFRCARAAR